MWSSFLNVGAKDVVQILVLASFYYFALIFFRGTRGAQVLVGLLLVITVLLGLTHLMRLDALNWLVRRLSVFLGIALLIIFQPELRRALAELGKQSAFGGSHERRSTVDSVVAAVLSLAEHRIGALIAVERDIGTLPVQESGVKLDAPVIPELLATIFYPHTPMHDGGVVISKDRVAAAGCVFPLSPDPGLRQLGTRHRAAVGLSEETDAVVVAVSGETGAVSVAYGGRLNRGLDEERLRRLLGAVLLKDKPRDTAWRRARRQLDLTLGNLARVIERTDTGAKEK